MRGVRLGGGKEDEAGKDGKTNRQKGTKEEGRNERGERGDSRASSLPSWSDNRLLWPRRAIRPLRRLPVSRVLRLFPDLALFVPLLSEVPVPIAAPQGAGGGGWGSPTEAAIAGHSAENHLPPESGGVVLMVPPPIPPL